jgi:hypothetical protein
MPKIAGLALSAALCALGLAPSAHADSPPYLTTDTEPAEKIQAAPFVEASAMSGGYELTYAVDTAIPLAPGWEMTLVPRLVTIGDGRTAATGLGDTEIAVKYLAWSDKDAQVTIAFEPNVVLPTGGRRFGDDLVELELPILASKAWGPWSLSGEFGYERDGATSRNDHAPLSLLLERAVTGRFSVGVEMADDIPFRSGRRASLETNVGGDWTIRDGLQLELMVGRRTIGVDGPADLHSCLALAVEF